MTLLELVVKQMIICACKTGKKLTEIDLSKKDSFLSFEKINFGLGVESIIENLIKCDVVTIS